MRKVKGLLGIIVGSFLLLHAGGTLAYADDKGNNGTLKVVSATDPGADMDNDPKVCQYATQKPVGIALCLEQECRAGGTP